MNILRDIENLIVNLVKTRDAKTIAILTESIPNIGAMRVEMGGIPLIHYAVDFNEEPLEPSKIVDFDADCLSLLLNNGGNVVDTSIHGSFFDRVIRAKNSELIAWLLENGHVRSDEPISSSGATALHIAAFDAVPEIFEQLLMDGINAEVPGCCYKYTPIAQLMLHSTNMNLQDLESIANSLIEHGADANPLVDSIYIDQKIPLSYELRLSELRRGDGYDYKSRAGLIEELNLKTVDYDQPYADIEKLVRETHKALIMEGP